MIISINAKEATDKIQHCFMMKSLSQIEIDENYNKIIKTIYENPELTSNSMLKI